ncbi:phage holin family protein [Rhodococcus sp. NPDC003382]|uniref:phage holin family protein n=1 Tax=unclassified Rhodococcus (in: high G+C Gram-positive bacteria) TaxID=192944 RepID=UPI0018CE60D9|nr:MULTISPECIES: phage holin family protein [unclassified Rhodococcus (in: high G+C Gram-positive bacteria)]MBH0122700.1 phage holin family protein [Rhodococcus sp. CX]MCK8669737.1 phage holin family protein [Rhodococcus sp. HM1]
MMRLLATAVVALIANAIALIVGAWVLPDMSLTPVAFLIAVVIFTVVAVVIDPLIRQVSVTKAPVLLGSSALVSTLVALIVTALVSDGLKISGITTWVLATVIVWAVSVIARLLLPMVIFRKTLAARK